MASEYETVREVCAEMYRIGNTYYEAYADRILAAHERELAAKAAEIARLNDELFAYAGGHVITGAERYQREKIRQLEEEVTRLKAGINDYANLQKNITALRAEMTLKQSQVCEAGQRIRKLEAALEPVLECDTMDEEFGLDDAVFAVREAQRIYNERRREEKENPLPCPFCGKPTGLKMCIGGTCVVCDCGYMSMQFKDECDDDESVANSKAIAAHNRVAKAAKESEAKHEAR